MVVMDNAPYHSARSENNSTMAWKKAEIVEWLHSKGKKIDPSHVIQNDLVYIAKHIKSK